VAGQAKTRLGATIGMERAAELYRACLHDLAGRFMGAPAGYDIGWAHTPESAPFEEVIRGIRPDLDAGSARYVSQVGDDWGERQANLLRWGNEHGYVRTVLTASDSPQMSRGMVDAAFAALVSSDVVVGRVHDGGYYLIGMRGFHDVLTGVPMSTVSAADALIAKSEDLGLRVATVEPTFDLDVEPDLALLAALCRNDALAAPATFRAFRELGLCAGAGQPKEPAN
jgi:glycosyltransferase A (GT-A) superfamily protein (DUF2064 family)